MLLTITAAAVVFTGGLAEQLGNVIGVGHSAVTIWDIAKWPVLLLVVAFILVDPLLGRAERAPTGIPLGDARRHCRGRRCGCSHPAAFAFYVANFSSYNKTYGAMASVIIFLVWLWITNTVILLGAELNAEIERGRQIEAGHARRPRAISAAADRDPKRR